MLLARNWWMFLLRGLVAILFGVVALFYPAAAFLSLVLVFGVFALFDGILTIVAAFAGNARSENWWWLIFEGMFGILVGVLTIWQPAAMGLAWIFIIALSMSPASSRSSAFRLSSTFASISARSALGGLRST